MLSFFLYSYCCNECLIDSHSLPEVSLAGERISLAGSWLSAFPVDRYNEDDVCKKTFIVWSMINSIMWGYI